MVLQTETYPGYSAVNDGYYSSNSRYSNFNPNIGPTPQTTTHVMPNHSYTHSLNEKMSSFKRTGDVFNRPGGQPHHGQLNGGYGTHNGSHGSHQGSYGSHQGSYGSHHANTHQTDHYSHGPHHANTHQTDHYSHGSTGNMSHSDTFRPSGGQFHQVTPNSGYGSHHGSHSPTYQNGGLGTGGGRYPTGGAYQSPGEIQNSSHWELKCIED